MPEKLVFVDSLHEQREFNRKIIPVKGSWLEVGEFVPVVESFNILERWKCLDVSHVGVDDASTLAVDLELLDHHAELERSKKVIAEIMVKHGQLLVDSLRFMIIKGLSTKSCVVNDLRKESITQKLKTVGLDPDSKTVQLLQHQKRLVNAQKRVDIIQRKISELGV